MDDKQKYIANLSIGQGSIIIKKSLRNKFGKIFVCSIISPTLLTVLFGFICGFVFFVSASKTFALPTCSFTPPTSSTCAAPGCTSSPYTPTNPSASGSCTCNLNGFQNATVYPNNSPCTGPASQVYLVQYCTNVFLNSCGNASPPSGPTNPTCTNSDCPVGGDGTAGDIGQCTYGSCIYYPGCASDNWAYCSGEGQTCSTPAGVNTPVVFSTGWADSYGSYIYGESSGSIDCSGSVFGDPDPGTGKECFYCVPPPVITPTNTPPSPPSGAASSNSLACGIIVVAWQNVPAATSYQVFKSTANSIPGSPVATGITSLNWTDASPDSAGDYYWVEAVNSAGASAPTQAVPSS